MEENRHRHSCGYAVPEPNGASLIGRLRFGIPSSPFCIGLCICVCFENGIPRRPHGPQK